MIDNDPNRRLTLEEAEAEIAKRYGIPDAVWKRMVQQESGGRTDAVSPKGARGRWQVMPATAKSLGIDLNDDLQVAEGGLRLLRDNYKRFRKYAKNEKHAWMAAVAAYHAGPGAVEKDFKRGGVGLPETSDGQITTRNHVLKIFDGIPSTAFDRSPLGNVGQAAITGQPQSVPPAAAPFSFPQQTGEMPKRMEMPVNPETGNYSTPEQMEIYNQVFPNQPAPRLPQGRIGQQLQGAAKELLTGQPEQPTGRGLQPMFPEPPQPQPGQAGQGGPLQLEGGFTTDPDQAHVPQGGVRVTKDGKSYLATPQGNGQFSIMEETPETSYREYIKAVGMPDGPEAMQAFKDAQAALQKMGQGQMFPRQQFAPGVPAQGAYPQGVRRVPQQWTAAEDGKDWNDQQLGESWVVYGVNLTGRERDPKRVAAEKVWRAAAAEYGMTPEQTQAAIKETADLGYLTKGIDRGTSGQVNIRIRRGTIAKYAGIDKVRQQFERERSEPQHFLYQQIQALNEQREQGEPRLTLPRGMAEPTGPESEQWAEQALRQNLNTAQGRASLHLQKMMETGGEWVSHPAALLNPLAAFILGGTYAHLTADTGPGGTLSREAEDREIARLKDTYKTFNRAWQAERAYQGMGRELSKATGLPEGVTWWMETAARGAAQVGRSFTKNVVSGTAKSVALLSQVFEDLTPINRILPDEAKVGVRNAGNTLEFILRLMQERGRGSWQRAVDRMDYVGGSDDLLKQHLFRAATEFEEAVGSDPKLQNRFVGQLADGLGSAGAFIALGVLMPSMRVPIKEAGRIARAFPQLGNFVNLSPAAAGALQMAGPGYEEGRKSGLNENYARGYGVLMGLLGATEILGAGGRLSAELGQPWMRGRLAAAMVELMKKPGSRVLGGALQEAKQEFAQEVFQTVAGQQLLAGLRDVQNGKAIAENLRQRLNELPQQLADAMSNEGLVAAITGGLMGGSGAAIGAIAELDLGREARRQSNIPEPPPSFSGGEFVPAGPGLPPAPGGAGALTQPPGITQRADGVYESPAGQVQEARQLPGEVATPEQQAAGGIEAGQQGPAGLPEAPAKRIAEPIPASIEKAATDVRAQKVLNALNDLGEATIEDLRKKTRYAPSNVQGAVDLLYEAGLVEITPNGTIRASGATIEPGSIYDRYDEQGKVSQPPAPVVSQQGVQAEPGQGQPAQPVQPTQTAQPTVGQPVSPGQQTVTSERPTEPTEPSGLSPYTESQIRRDQFTHPQYNIRQLAEEMGITPDAVRAALPDIDKLTPGDFARKYNVPVEAVNKLRPLGEIGYDGYMAHRVRATTLDPNNEGMFNELSDIFTNGDLRFRDADFQTRGGIADALMDQIAASVGKPRASQMTRDDWESVLNTHADRMNINTVKAIVAALDEHAEWVKAVDAFLADPELAEVIADVFDEFGVSTWRDLTEISVVANLEKKGLPVTPEAFSRAGLSSGGPTAKLRKEILRIGRKYATKLNDAGNPILTDDAIRRAYDRAVYARTGGSPQGRPADGPSPRVPGGGSAPTQAPAAATGRRSAVDTELAVNAPPRSMPVEAGMPVAETKPEPAKPAAKKEVKSPDLPDMPPAEQKQREVYPKTGKEQREIIDTIRENAPLERKFYAMSIDERKGFMATLPPGATRGEIANAFDEWRKPAARRMTNKRPENDVRDDVADGADDILFSASALEGSESEREQEVGLIVANRSALIPYTTPIIRELSKIKSGKVKRQTLEQMVNRPGIKGAEKKLLESLLARFDDYEMSADDLAVAAALEVTPLSVVAEHSGYDTYGLSTVGLPANGAKTLIFNTPYDFGYTGHFSGEFGARDTDKPPQWAPRATQDEAGRTVWIALDEANVPPDTAQLTEENAGNYIGVVADDLATVEGWIAAQDTFFSPEAPHAPTTLLNRGLFGHGRGISGFDNGETAIYVEMQTDTLQKNSPADLLAKHYQTIIDRGGDVSPEIRRAVNVYKAKTRKWARRPHNWAAQIRTAEGDVASLQELVRVLDETAPIVMKRLKSEYGNMPMTVLTWQIGQELTKALDEDNTIPLKSPVAGSDAVAMTAEAIYRAFKDIPFNEWEARLPLAREEARRSLEIAENDLRSFDDLRRAKLRADRAATAFIAALPLKDQLFASYAKSARVRLLREVIRREALAGRKTFRIATERTLAAVEGFSAVNRAPRPQGATTAETGEGPFGMPYDPGVAGVDEDLIDTHTVLDVGEEIEYNGETYEIIRSDAGTFEAVEQADIHYADYNDWAQGEMEYIGDEVSRTLSRARGFVSAAKVANGLADAPYVNVGPDDLIDAISHDLGRDEFVVSDMLARLKEELEEAEDAEKTDIENEIERLEAGVKAFKDDTFIEVLGKLTATTDSAVSFSVHLGHWGRPFTLDVQRLDGSPQAGYQAEIKMTDAASGRIAMPISALSREHLLERAAAEMTRYMMERGHADDLIDWDAVNESDLIDRLLRDVELDYSSFADYVESDAQWTDPDYQDGIRYVPSHVNTINFDQPGTYFSQAQFDREYEADEMAGAAETRTESNPEGWNEASEITANPREYSEIGEAEWARMVQNAELGTMTPAGTVLKKHGELLKDFKKERPDWRVWTDPMSNYQYLETTLTEADKGDIVAFDKGKDEIRAEANRVRSLLKDLRDTAKWTLRKLASMAQARVRDGILDGNAPMVEIIRRAALQAYGQDMGYLYGVYFAPNAALKMWTTLKDMANSAPDIATATAIRQVAAEFAAAMDRRHGDLIFVPTLPRSSALREHTLSEELAHRADYRSRGFRTIHDTSRFDGIESYKKAAAEVRRNYPTVPDHIVHAEVVAKSFRTDAMDELGLTADEVVELRRAYADQLLDAGITAPAILENFRDVKTTKELTNQIRQRRDREKSGLANARGPDGRFVPSGAGQGTQQPAGRATEGQKEKEDAVALPDDASILRQAEADDILFSRPKFSDIEDTEQIKKDIDFNAKQLMSYIYDGKRDVRWPEAAVNLIRSGYLAGYSVIGTNVAWNTANVITEEIVKGFALPVDWTRRQIAKNLDQNKTDALLAKADKRLADAKRDLALLEEDKQVNAEAIKAQTKLIESIQAERRRIRARRGPNATKRAVAGTRPGDVIAGLFGETGFFREGLGYGPRGLMGALKEGIPAEEAKKFDFAGEDAPDQSFVRNTGVPLIDVIIEATKRISMGVDRPFKAYARTSQQRATARAMARDMVDAGVAKDWKEMADRLIMDPNEAMTDLAERYAQIVTFQNPNPLTDAADAIRASLLSNQIVERVAPELATHTGVEAASGALYVGIGATFPFIRTPSNIGIRALEYTPLGIVSAAWHFHKVGNGYERMLHEIEKKQQRDEQDAKIKKLKDDDIEATKAALKKLAMQYAQKKAELDERVRLAGKNEGLVKRNKDAFKKWNEGFKAAKEKAEAEQKKLEADLRAKWKKQDQALEDARRIEDDAHDMQFSLLEWNRMASAFGRFGMGTTIGGLILAGVFYGIIDAVGRIGWDDEDRDESKRKEEMRKAGINDFTVQIGGRRYQYDRFPAGQALGMGVNVLEQMQRPGTNRQRFQAAGDKLLTDILNSNPITDARFEQSDGWSKVGSYMKSLTPIVNMKIWQEIGDVADEKNRTSFNKGFAAQYGRQMPIPALRDAFGVPESKMPLGGRRKTFGERLGYTLDPTKSMPATRSGRSMPVIPLKDPGEKARPKVRW